jgi:hypothetical protein
MAVEYEVWNAALGGILVMVLSAMSVYSTVQMNTFDPLGEKDSPNVSRNILSNSQSIQNSITLLGCAVALIAWYELHELIFHVVIAAFISFFFPYLRKPSKYISYCVNGLCERYWDDKLIYTSLVYAVGGGVALYHEQYVLAFVSTITSIGSILYHRHREGQFFNFDNIFATSHVVMFLYAIYDAYENHWEFFLLSAGGLPIAAFLLVYCGDPADVTKNEVPIVRYSRKIYDDYHTLWHLASGFGPMLVSFYFEGKDLDMIVYIGVCISFTINITANYVAAVPFD